MELPRPSAPPAKSAPLEQALKPARQPAWSTTSRVSGTRSHALRASSAQMASPQRPRTLASATTPSKVRSLALPISALMVTFALQSPHKVHQHSIEARQVHTSEAVSVVSGLLQVQLKVGAILLTARMVRSVSKAQKETAQQASTACLAPLIQLSAPLVHTCRMLPEMMQLNVWPVPGVALARTRVKQLFLPRSTSAVLDTSAILKPHRQHQHLFAGTMILPIRSATLHTHKVQTV